MKTQINQMENGKESKSNNQNLSAQLNSDSNQNSNPNSKKSKGTIRSHTVHRPKNGLSNIL